MNPFISQINNPLFLKIQQCVDMCQDLYNEQYEDEAHR